MTKVAEIAKLAALPGKRSELLAALSRMVEQANTEVGTEIFVMHEATDDLVTIWTYELYSDQAARDVHGSSAAMREIRPAIAHLVAGPAEIVRLVPAMAKSADEKNPASAGPLGNLSV
ncbi:putative quinol monooxygenase [Rhodococcus sp. WAY2]|uniref:putative quinol monooxygenase n=1 Tax=Rhodococcus sp. WAY2 TaxID=2663121 RepID=UPI00135884A8|nr:antibiotic biosynthesis monooxygenase [Rhodococcus sp. WAY2]